MGNPAIIVIGGGLVGLATALKIGAKFPSARITLLEKEDAVGCHQSGHNSGVLHAGLYYKPGSLKARMAVEGIREMVAFCERHGVPHEICGKLVVAVDESEISRLKSLHERGMQNGLHGLRWLDAAEMRRMEPHAGGIAALHVPQEGIVDYPKVCAAMVQEIAGQGGQVITGAKVSGLRLTGSKWVATTGKGDFEADFIVNCAGLHCDRQCLLLMEPCDQMLPCSHC